MRSIKLLVAITGLFLSSVALAGQWKPLCIEGGVCNLGSPSIGVGPLLTSQGFLLNYKVIDYSSSTFVNKLILSTPEGLTGPSSFKGGASDLSSIELPDGKKFSFNRYGLWSWYELDDELIYTNYSGNDTLNSRMKAETGPPVIIDGTVYIGNTYFSTVIYYSDDNGVTWNQRQTGFAIGADRLNLLKNPEGTNLWAIKSERFEEPGSLWESPDRGESWARVDDGSFPAFTMRVVHDPRNLDRSYALTNHGLYLSLDRGVSWQETEFIEAIHSLLFIERGTGHSRLVVIGTDTGVRMSTDEMVSWTDISSGLLAQQHSVVYGDGQLIATSSSGYYSCELMDCFGAAQAILPEEDRGLVDVVEFYHPDLDHYFITATQEEANAIDQGVAGPG